MRNGETRTVAGAWSENDNAWVSETLHLTGECYLEVTLPGKGRLIVKKSENENGPFPKAIISDWSGPQFKVRLYGTTENRYVKVFLSSTPLAIQLSSM